VIAEGETIDPGPETSTGKQTIIISPTAGVRTEWLSTPWTMGQTGGRGLLGWKVAIQIGGKMWGRMILAIGVVGGKVGNSGDGKRGQAPTVRCVTET
jgi:hypothetical protein